MGLLVKGSKHVVIQTGHLTVLPACRKPDTLSNWQMASSVGHHAHRKQSRSPPLKLNTWRSLIVAAKLSGCIPLWGSSASYSSSQFQLKEITKGLSSCPPTPSQGNCRNTSTSVTTTYANK